MSSAVGKPVGDGAAVGIIRVAGDGTPDLGDRPAILAADQITPGQLMGLDRERLLGVVTRQGAPNSRAAILARGMEVPALTGVDFDESWDGLPGLLDCGSGTFTADPEPEQVAAALDRVRESAEWEELLRSVADSPSVTLDGSQVRICANIAGPEEALHALRNGAQGVGLFRTEFLFLRGGAVPSEQEQFEVYQKTVGTMEGAPVTIRTIDLEGDELSPPEPAENPALSRRAVRLCLERRDLFKPQLRAILRAAACGDVSVLFPMISSVQELREAKAVLAECRAELEAEGTKTGRLEVGAMIETPAAALIAGELAQEADFLSIGSNDLAQYALAADRQTSRMGEFYDPCHPAVLRLIALAAQAGREHSRRVALCGELAADLSLSAAFLRMGIGELSVSPASLLALRAHIRTLHLGEDELPQKLR